MEKSKIVLFTVLLSTLFVFCAWGCAVTTAKLSEATMATSVNPETKQPIEKTDVFATDTPEIFCSVKVSNAPQETDVKAVWHYTEPGSEQEIDSYSIEVEGTRYVDFSLTIPTAGWPAGSYEIRLHLDDKLQETVPFTVK